MAEHGSVVLTFAAPGALSANWVIDYELPHAFMPQHVSFVGSNAHDATLDLGTSASAAAVIDDMAGGDSGDPAEYTEDDFEDADYQYSKGDILRVTVDYDGASGTAIQDPVIAIKGLLGE